MKKKYDEIEIKWNAGKIALILVSIVILYWMVVHFEVDIDYTKYDPKIIDDPQIGWCSLIYNDSTLLWVSACIEQDAKIIQMNEQRKGLLIYWED